MASKRLLWQLYPSYVYLAVIAVVALMWFANRSLRQFYLDRTAADLEARARLIEAQLPLSITDRERSSIGELCRQLGGRSGTEIRVLLPDGTVVGDSNRDAADVPRGSDDPEIATALNGDVGTAVRSTESGRRRLMYVAVPVGHAVPPRAVVRTAVSVEAVDRAVRDINRRLALGGAAALLISAFISIIVSRRIARPLRELTRGAERFAGGTLDSPLPVPDSDEIGALAEAMNKMARHLDDRIQTVVQQKKQEDAILASMVESVLAVDAEGRVLEMNQAAAELFEIRYPRAKGQLLQEIVRHSELQELVTHALASDEPVEGEIALYDPEERFLQVHGTVLRDSAGRNIGALMVLNDVTRLRRLERVRRDFVANVSHELKTPITTIKGFVETLLDGALASKEDAERFLRIVGNHTERLNSIIEDLLSLSRIEQETDQDEIELETTRIQPVLRQAIDVCRASAQARNVTVKLGGDGRLECRLNAPLLEQAVVNLVDNAIKYSDEGGVVEVRAVRTGDSEIAVEVEDHGCGIEDEHLPRLFERFYRTDKARSRKLGGTGLGLAIVKHIALAHGGRVDVESRVGEGSMFSIRLPG